MHHLPVIKPIEAKLVKAPAQHTPGPWHIGRTITGSEEDIQLSGLTGDGRKKYDCFVVAPAYTVAGVGGIGKEETRANARIIASAPALLGALKDCVESLERLPDLDGAYRQTCINQARAAIALAEGGVNK